MKLLPLSQFEVMKVLWDHSEEYGGKMTRKQIHSYLDNKNWQMVTLNTFLNRLVQSKYLEIEHSGKEYLYIPLIQKEQYLAYEGRSVLQTFYQNSLKKFVASIYDYEDITDDEIEELQTYLNELKGEK